MTEDRFERQHGATDLGQRAGSAEHAPSWGEEQALRALLHRAVAGVQPAPDALPRIRSAVPARRARYRHAWTGAVLIALVSAVAVPTLQGLGALQLSDGSAPSAGLAPGGEASTATGGTHRHSSNPSVPVPVPAQGGSASATSSAPATDPGATGAPSPSPSTVAASASGTASAPTTPGCAPGDLGGATATAQPADSSGRVYGVFSVANVSGHACLLAAPGPISATATGAGTVQVVAHTTGDPATALPPPGPTAPTARLLSAGGGYQLRFAWVPDTTCPTNGQNAVPPAATSGASPTTSSSGGPSPAGSPVGHGPVRSNGSPAAADASAATSPSPAAPSPSATPSPTPSTGTEPGSLTIGHRLFAGLPDAVSVTIANVCAGGTVYREAPEAAG
ncbi:hypothetical protein [Kitasatospora azatica]|uniref:hypothetical protein n=1 Tax=Kitasatospora azatica TaxID=58347 RepID=UPI00068D62C2|nr:hypothetical protein [Kitasatospora azatica]